GREELTQRRAFVLLRRANGAGIQECRSGKQDRPPLQCSFATETGRLRRVTRPRASLTHRQPRSAYPADVMHVMAGLPMSHCGALALLTWTGSTSGGIDVGHPSVPNGSEFDGNRGDDG